MKIIITETQLKFIKNIQPNQLTEDVKLSIKLLNDNNIPLDNPDYLSAKEFLLKRNSIGYLGPIVKLSITNKIKIIKMAEYVINNKELISLLNKPLLLYNDFDELENDIEKLITNRILKKLINKLTNKRLISLILGQDDFDLDSIDEIKYFLTIPSSNQKEFLIKTDKYNNLDVFLKNLISFNEDYMKGFTYDRVLSLIKQIDGDEIKLLYNKNNLILTWIKKYEASNKIGSKSWCIVGNEYDFKNYTNNGINYQYFLFNFNDDVLNNEKMIAFTLTPDNDVIASHDRYDSQFNKVKNYLTSIGILEKIYTINTRLKAEHTIDKYINDSEDILLVVPKKDVYVGNYYVPANNYNKILKELLNKFKTILSNNLFKYNENLDLLVDKLQQYPVYYQYKRVSSVNLISTLAHSGNWNEDEKEIMIKFFEKLYISSLKLNKDSKFTIGSLLNNNGVDMVKLSKLKKDKNNQDLSGYEFNNLTKKGVNLKPIIQNKLSAIRRGEDVDITPTEINYAIDNGYKNIIEKYYKNMIPSFETNQLSYEDLQIYKKLGMLSNIQKVIISKVKNYGTDTLNSIEKSLYDTSPTKII